MTEERIRNAWYEIEKLFGPDYYEKNIKLKIKAQVYAELVLEANDYERIKEIGKKHLILVSENLLDGKQFRQFLHHVICYERFL